MFIAVIEFNTKFTIQCTSLNPNKFLEVNCFLQKFGIQTLFGISHSITNYKDPLWLGKILGNNVEWTLFYATKSYQLLIVVSWPSWKMMDANVYFMKQDKCWNVFWLWDLVTSTLIQHALLDQGPYAKTTWVIVQTFKLSTQPWRTIDRCLL
jgi:hypothetical protein